MYAVSLIYFHQMLNLIYTRMTWDLHSKSKRDLIVKNLQWKCESKYDMHKYKELQISVLV